LAFFTLNNRCAEQFDFRKNQRYILQEIVDDRRVTFGDTLVKKFFVAFFLLCIPFHHLDAQDSSIVGLSVDSTRASGNHQQPLQRQLIQYDPTHSWGVDLLISTGGFGLGSFYRKEYSDDLSGFIDFSISEAKDDDERDFIDIYGNRFTPGKVNRFLVMPLFIGVQKRLFKDDIVDNFRPYVSAAAGPSMIYVFPNDQEYFSALGKGQPKYTVGGYLGIGAFFGSERTSLLGINLRYYFMPYFSGLESLQGVNKTQFGGFFITVNLGSTW
jgi:hypothetical protein